MSETLEQPPGQEDADNSNEVTAARKRRRFRPDEIALAKRFTSLAEVGTPIAFSDLDTEMKRAVLPNRQTRLVDRGLLEVDYDEDTGLLKSVTVNAEMLKEYEWDLTPIVPESRGISSTRTQSGEPRKRRPRNLLADPKYKIKRLKDTNPRKVGSHGWYNWEHCYLDDMSIPDYLSRKDYPRTIITKNDTYFNGPSTLFIEQDMQAKIIGIYDSTLPFTLENGEPNPAIWLTMDDLRRVSVEEPDPVEEEAVTEETTESAESESTQPMVA